MGSRHCAGWFERRVNDAGILFADNEVARVVRTRVEAKVYYVSLEGGQVVETELPAEMIICSGDRLEAKNAHGPNGANVVTRPTVGLRVDPTRPATPDSSPLWTASTRRRHSP